MPQTARAVTAWRFFPLAIVGGIGLTVVVNAAMIWSAIATFPGRAGRDGFELSNKYNLVLDRQALQSNLGWSVAASVSPQGRPLLRVTDATGQAFPGTLVAAVATRPLGDRHATELVFADHGDGRFVADQVLALPGQWDLAVTATAGERTLTITRRVHVP